MQTTDRALPASFGRRHVVCADFACRKEDCAVKDAAAIRLLYEELDHYYTNFDPCGDMLLQGLHERVDGLPMDDPFGRKTAQIEYLCGACPVHIFRHTPLFFEISSGRPRHSWGGCQSSVGMYLNIQTAPLWHAPYFAALQKDQEEAFLTTWASPASLDHHCPGYDNLLALGVKGIIGKAKCALSQCTDPGQQAFYQSVIRCNEALIRLAHRFAEEARSLAEAAADEETRLHYEKIAETAEYIPANPPRTFYEALEMILFYRECVGSLEGIGISTFAQLDRMLYPYYQADLAAGRMTEADAENLLCDLLLYTEVRFETDKAYFETSTTIELGGCDRNGQVIFNEVTQLILRAVMGIRSINTKINCRISKAHPRAYLDMIAQVQLSKLPCVMMHNDDVLIPARVQQGQDAEDARLYVGCGCHEIVLSNTEVCSRADTWISLPRILLRTLEQAPEYASFEEFYAAFMADARAYYQRIVDIRNRYEAYWCQYAPLPLYSSSLTGPLETGRDVSAGGAKYNTTSPSLLGAASLIDSLYSVKQLVYDEKRLTLSKLHQIVVNNFENEELLRQYIIHKIPKHGVNHPLLNDFSRRVLSDLSTIAGQTNARGGRYLPAFYPHETYRHMGLMTGATPDGRLANTPLSRGISPSEFVECDSPLDIIHSLKHIDFTQYAESFIADLNLPQMDQSERSRTILTSIILAFLEAGGSSLQFNLTDHAALLDARQHPEQHPNLLVRVCGYSSAFIYLHPIIQDEIIDRAVR